MARWGLKFYFSSVLRVSVSWEDVIFFILQNDFLAGITIVFSFWRWGI